jgi:hypothetical protein
MEINVSVVLYNTTSKDINNLLASLDLIKLRFKVYIIDNSPTDALKEKFKCKDYVVYIHNPANPGFGASHNIAMQLSIKDNVPYHLVINPDVYFKEDVITLMVDYLKKNSEIGMMMPKILNLDGSVQYLPKLLPSPFSILIRKLKWPKVIYSKFIDNYELRFVDNSIIYNTPVISGCFTLFNVNKLKEIGLYDDHYFMYFEDWDISRRMHMKYKTVYYPKVSVYHGYESGANKNIRLFKIYLKSAYYYFSKWGCFFDKDRSKINKSVLSQFK